MRQKLFFSAWRPASLCLPQAQELFWKTILADGLLTLGVLLLVCMISHILDFTLYGQCQMQDKLSLAEARKNIISVITDAEMLLKDDRLVAACGTLFLSFGTRLTPESISSSISKFITYRAF